MADLLDRLHQKENEIARLMADNIRLSAEVKRLTGDDAQGCVMRAALERIAKQQLVDERLVEGGDYEYGYEQIVKLARAALAAETPAAPVETSGNLGDQSPEEILKYLRDIGDDPAADYLEHRWCSAATEELKPCPFCGKPPVMISSTEDDSFVRCYEIRCDQCGIEVSEEYKGETIERWNTRAEPQAASLRFALADALDSPTVQAVAQIMSFRNQDLSKSLSEQLADVLEARLSLSLTRPEHS